MGCRPRDAWCGSDPARLAGQPGTASWPTAHRTALGHPRPVAGSRAATAFRLSELRRRILLQALRSAGYPDEEAASLAEGAFQAFLAARHRVSFFDDVHSTLEQLARDYTLGVITNGNADIRRLGLADYFRFAVSAEQLGIGKPDPRPFQEALRLAGISANQAVHIGDHPLDDIAGARQAGLQAIWFNPQGQPWQASTAPPTAQVRRLAELPGLLRGGLSRQ